MRYCSTSNTHERIVGLEVSVPLKKEGLANLADMTDNRGGSGVTGKLGWKVDSEFSISVTVDCSVFVSCSVSVDCSVSVSVLVDW